MENYEWIFDGIGTELISLAVGAIAGCFAGYKIAVRNIGKQRQKAKFGAKQRQELTIDNDATDGKECIVQNSLQQVQKAGIDSEQVQIGRLNSGRH